jgi:Ni/Co efflux regulator RcnB
MKQAKLLLQCAALAVIGALMTVPAAFADKPEWAGKGKNKHKEEHRDDNRHESRREHFRDHDRVVIREYYEHQYHRGHCPPGLAKKNNGCMPPGQAKKWAYGRPLPRDVVYYEVPRDVIVRLGPPPSGYRYVRVASDILMIAIGTSLVVDAITDLGRG